ncbi:MAG: sugar nucleotide-binding protein [Desulfobacteraceae bacterium]|nr:sugar nucleotide-binding protein [Desulfobacteraceae bacterium]
MKALVLGGSGMAGHIISLYFKEMGHDVTVFSRRKIEFCNYISGDIIDFNNLRRVINKGKYDAIINSIGILNQDAEKDKSKAILVNSYLPHFLSEVSKNTETKIIQISTDCVFSGKTGNYTENSLKDGESFYDRTKALGELDNNKDLTFRNSIIGPDINECGIGLFNWFMKQEGEIFGFTGAIWSGVTNLTLAKAMEKAIQENLSGVYNLVNNSNISKFGLLTLFNKHMRNEKLKILENDKIKLDKSLINNRQDFSFKVPSYETMIIEMNEWILNHKEIYPHYFRKGAF